MNLIQELKQEAERNAALANPSIILTAFHSLSLSCPFCNYPSNHEKFADLLWQYIVLRKMQYRAKKKWERYERDWLFAISDDSFTSLVTTRATVNQSHKVSQDTYYWAKRSADSSRLLLLPYWPCHACQVRFNPFGRVSTDQNGKRVCTQSVPVLKDSIDDWFAQYE